MRMINIFAHLVLAASLAGGLVACSSSEFDANPIKQSGHDDAKAETDEAAGDAGDAGDTAVSDNGSGGETLNPDGAKELGERSDDARRNDINETVDGCALPPDIADKVNAGSSNDDDGAGLLGLLGWGSSDSASPKGIPELTNLDLNDCAWFKADKDKNIKQVYVFQQKSLGLVDGVTQSYVEPVPEGAAAFCGRNAMSIANSVRDRGTFTCAFLPAADGENPIF